MKFDTRLCGLRQDSTGGKQKLGPISKQGDQYLRRILVVGAHAILKRARHQPEKYPWVTRLLGRKPFRVVAVALANKMARIAWALRLLKPVSNTGSGSLLNGPDRDVLSLRVVFLR